MFSPDAGLYLSNLSHVTGDWSMVTCTAGSSVVGANVVGANVVGANVVGANVVGANVV